MTIDPTITQTPDAAAPAETGTPAAPSTTETPAEGGTPATQEETQLLFAEDKPAEGEGDAGDADNKDDAEGDKDKEGDDEDAAALSLEDFEIGDDYAVSDEVKGALEGIINNKDLDEKGKVQGLIDLHKKIMGDQVQAYAKFREELRTNAKNDPVIGGDKLPDAIKNANRAVRMFAKDAAFGGSEEMFNGFQSRLIEMGLGDDPFVIRFLNNVSRAVAEDTITNAGAGGQSEKSIEQILFPNMK